MTAGLGSQVKVRRTNREAAKFSIGASERAPLSHRHQCERDVDMILTYWNEPAGFSIEEWQGQRE